MRFLDTQKEYSKLYKKYMEMSNPRRRIERAHYKYQLDTYPVLGLYITLIAMFISNVLIGNEWVSSKGLIFVFLILVVLWIGRYIIREASVHVSVIDDVEVCLKNNDDIIGCDDRENDLIIEQSFGAENIKNIYIMIIIFILVIVVEWTNITIKLSYQDWGLIVKLFTGMAPVIAACLAFWSWKKNREKEIKNLEYKNDYYKKIIDKRIDAYDELHKLLSLIDQVAGITLDEEEIYYHHMFFNNDKIQKVIEQMELSIKKNLWFENHTVDVLNRLNMLVISIRDHIGNLNEKELYQYFSKHLNENYDKVKEDFNKHYLNLDRKVPAINILQDKLGKDIDRNSVLMGLFVFAEMFEMCMMLRDAIYNDMLSLEKIDEFLKSKKKN